MTRQHKEKEKPSFREEFSWKKAYNPFYVFKTLHKLRYTYFFAIGVGGVLINLFITWVLTEFVFGLERYFAGYLVGLVANLIFNFVMHTKVTFQTTKNHEQRFIVFMVYSLIFSAIQSFFIKIITPIVGYEYYLFVIAGVIFILSFVNFALSKLFIFNENKKPKKKKKGKK